MLRFRHAIVFHLTGHRIQPLSAYHPTDELADKDLRQTQMMKEEKAIDILAAPITKVALLRPWRRLGVQRPCARGVGRAACDVLVDQCDQFSVEVSFCYVGAEVIGECAYSTGIEFRWKVDKVPTYVHFLVERDDGDGLVALGCR